MIFHDKSSPDSPRHQLEQHLAHLCRENPELLKYQEEISSYLAKSGSAENRMAVLEFLLEERLAELYRHLSEMIRIISKINL